MKKLSLMLLLSTLASASFALQPGDKVENFKLLDHTGKMHELHYLSDMEAVVLMVHGNGCPIARNALHTYKDLREQYADKGVTFLMINSNLQDNRQSIAAEAEEFEIDFPILVDDTQLIGESLGIERTADAYVIDPKTWKVVYRGSLDDRLGYETQKIAASENYVANALDAMLADKPLEVTAVEAKGCLVNLPELTRRDAHENISYANDVAPILMENCVSCHHEGGIGPFAMSEYNMVKGFAPMIREVIRTQRMPPWHADPHYGEFANDRSLTNQEKQTLVHWIEAGAPRGDGEDPLANADKEFPEWAMGTPDAIVDFPAFDVPATGVVDYQYVTVENPFDHDVWVRGVDIIPGSREALHHVITTIGYANPEARNGFQAVGGMGGYVPGSVAEPFPEDTGTLLKAGMDIQFQVHYTTFGKAVTDQSHLGIYLYEEKPKYTLEGRFIMNPRFKIPAGAKEYTSQASWTVDKDLQLYALLPHSHYRGKASDFIAVYPDGREEILLSVPNYDFNWQTNYRLKEPKVLPAGTKIVHHTTWDNSAQNPANPDPTIDVTWGEQSWEEMLFGSLSYRYLEEDSEQLTQAQTN